MIGIKGQWFLQLSLGDKKSFIAPQDLINFEIASKLGLYLPEFILIFRTIDDEITTLLNEGNKLKVTMGLDSDHSFTSEFIILKTLKEEQGSNQILIECHGLLNHLKFLDNKISTSEKISGVEEVLNQMKMFFADIDTNIEKSQDKQNWIKFNISSRQHVSNVLLHSWVEGSWLSCGIDMDGVFILRDIMKKIRDKGSDKYDWRFTKNPADERDIYYSKIGQMINDSGFVNAFAGYDRTQLVNDFASGEQSVIQSSSEPLLSQAEKLMRDKEVERRNMELVIKSNNLHDKYYEAFMKNLTQMSLFGTVTFPIVFENEYVPLKLLDLVMYSATSKKDSKFFNEPDSGLYFITKIIRIQRNNSFGTKVFLSREAVNSSTGALK